MSSRRVITLAAAACSASLLLAPVSANTAFASEGGNGNGAVQSQSVDRYGHLTADQKAQLRQAHRDYKVAVHQAVKDSREAKRAALLAFKAAKDDPASTAAQVAAAKDTFVAAVKAANKARLIAIKAAKTKLRAEIQAILG